MKLLSWLGRCGRQIGYGCLAAIAVASIFETVATARAATENDVEIQVLSSKPYLVSGETALVQISGPLRRVLPQVNVLVNGKRVTASFKRVQNNLIGLVTTLHQGENEIAVAAPDGVILNRLRVTDYPITGPMISGPQQEPFICQTQQFVLPDGTNLPPASEPECSVKTVVQYVYMSTTSETFVPLTNTTSLPSDVASTTTLDGVTVPYVVRVEIGTIDRSIYQIAILNDPTTQPNPTVNDPPKGWNKKLIWSHGGGCPPGWYIQGSTTGVVLDDQHLSEGFALASTSFNAPDQVCSAVKSGEATSMTKARFIERFGVPTYTMSIGCSGGSYDSELLADAHPGLFDGIVISCIFPDPNSIAISGMDARLLVNYYTNTAPGALTNAQILAVAGFAEFAQIPTAAVTADRTDPIQNRPPIPGVSPYYATSPTGADWDPDVPASLRYDPTTNPHGARPDIWDENHNIYGIDRRTGFALRPYDNTGIQYGLAALNSGAITKSQFLDLNENIGGFDIDDNYIPQRTVGDPGAIRRAYEGDLNLSGGGGLKSTAILGWNQIYSDLDPNGEYHLHYHMFEMRARIEQANGNTDNVVLWSAGLPFSALFTPTPTDTLYGNTLALQTTLAMDSWLTNVAADTSRRTLAAKVADDKPDSLRDGCWIEPSSGAPNFLAEKQFYGGPGTSTCNSAFPAFSWPRHVAGMPLVNNILKCDLKPIDQRDYAVRFTRAETARLESIFRGGVCDWSRPGVQHVPVVTDASFGPSPVNEVFNVVTGEGN